MRAGWLALLVVLASCERGPAPAGRTDPERRVEAPPTIAITATGPGNCSASWNGQAVTPQQITDRSIALLERVISATATEMEKDAAAGRHRETNDASLPVFVVEAPAELSFACADTILFSIQRAGVPRLRLRMAGGPAPVLADFPLDMNAPPPPIPMVLGIGAGGQVTWNNDPLDAAGLAAQLGRIGSAGPPVPGGEEPPPGGLELRVGREANFGQVYDLLRTTSRYRLRPVLYLPSAEAGPAPVAAPTPPPPRP